MEMQVKYHGREGRRTAEGYKIVHVVEVDDRTFTIIAATRQVAVEIAIQASMQ